MTENKGDLVSREALKEAIEQGEGFSWDSYGKDDLCVRKKYIDNAPTVEITEEQAIDKLYETGWIIRHDKEMTERPHGEWITTRTMIHDGNPYCSICDEENIIRSKFCPNCGASMVRGEDNGSI